MFTTDLRTCVRDNKQDVQMFVDDSNDIMHPWSKHQAHL